MKINRYILKFYFSILMTCVIISFSGCGADNNMTKEESNSPVTETQTQAKDKEKETKKMPLVLDGAKELSGHYYKTFEYWVTWDDAKAFCESVGGHLATAESDKECAVIADVLKNSSGGAYRHWMGATCDEKGVWKWITGGVIIYSNWQDKYPFPVEPADIQRNPSCGKLMIDESGKWCNELDASTAMVVCEWDSVEKAHDSDF